MFPIYIHYKEKSPFHLVGGHVKKLIIYSLIFSTLNLIGCYYQEQMNPKDYTFDEGRNIVVTTKDTTYQFKGKDYHLVSDTLFVKVEKKIDRKTTQISTIGIPLVNMDNVEIERNDAIGTLGTVLGVLVGVFALIIIISLSFTGFF